MYWNSEPKFIFLLNTTKSEIFYIFRYIVLFNAALRKQIWCKMSLHGINRKIFWEVHPFRGPPINLCSKTPVLVELSTKWSIESVTVKTRLAVEN